MLVVCTWHRLMEQANEAYDLSQSLATLLVVLDLTVLVAVLVLLGSELLTGLSFVSFFLVHIVGFDNDLLVQLAFLLVLIVDLGRGTALGLSRALLCRLGVVLATPGGLLKRLLQAFNLCLSQGVQLMGAATTATTR